MQGLGRGGAAGKGGRKEKVDRGDFWSGKKSSVRRRGSCVVAKYSDDMRNFITPNIYPEETYAFFMRRNHGVTRRTM